ncbi:MAG: acyl-CoA thioesterase [Gammaproteobacteria bacterium]|nr:acyl-CoA thioesterase [Gammaproteobacteria bacterium]
MDSLGHVNNIIYFRYFETARIAYFDRIGYWEEMEKSGAGPILAETRCRFRAPLRHPARISIGARVTTIEDDRFVMQYAVAASQCLAATGDGLVVSYNYRQSAKTTLPPNIVAAIEKLQDTDNTDGDA